MPVKVNLRHFERKESVDLKGQATPEDLEISDLHDELVDVSGPAEYDLEVVKQVDSLLVTGSIKMPITAHCARCLKDIPTVIDLPEWAAFVPLEGEDAVDVAGDMVDLTPFIREDILLAFPQHPLCKEECEGLPGTGAEAESKGDFSLDANKPSAWAELNKLKF